MSRYIGKVGKYAYLEDTGKAAAKRKRKPKDLQYKKLAVQQTLPPPRDRRGEHLRGRNTHKTHQEEQDQEPGPKLQRPGCRSINKANSTHGHTSNHWKLRAGDIKTVAGS